MSAGALTFVYLARFLTPRFAPFFSARLNSPVKRALITAAPLLAVIGGAVLAHDMDEHNYPGIFAIMFLVASVATLVLALTRTLDWIKGHSN